MKISLWNVNSLNVRLSQVLQCLEANSVDVLALQELKLNQNKFPISDLEQAGCHAAWFGQKNYNGWLCYLKVRHLMCLELCLSMRMKKRMIATTISGIRFINVYRVNGGAINSPKFLYK